MENYNRNKKNDVEKVEKKSERLERKKKLCQSKEKITLNDKKTTIRGKFKNATDINNLTGTGIVEYSESYEFFGTVVMGKKNGLGILSVYGDYKYVGYFKDDMRNGTGICEKVNPQLTIKGEWLNGVARDPFVVLKDNLIIYFYSGNPENGKAEIYKRNTKDYFGYSPNNSLEGKGKIDREMRRVYVGYVVDFDISNRKGYYYEYLENETWVYSAEISLGEMIGKCYLYAPNFAYQGYIENNLPQGEGKKYYIENNKVDHVEEGIFDKGILIKRVLGC